MRDARISFLSDRLNLYFRQIFWLSVLRTGHIRSHSSNNPGRKTHLRANLRFFQVVI